MLSDAELDGLLQRIEAQALPLLIRTKNEFRAGTLRGTSAWYQASYGTLIKGPRASLADFIIVISYAYSWLPRNHPTAMPSERQFELLLSAIKNVRLCARTDITDDEQSACRRALIVASQAALNISAEPIVTVSKVLHFWDPDLAPMMDVNIFRALGKLKFDPDAYQLGTMSTTLEGYLAYWQLIDRLVKRHNETRIGILNYRQLDELLFHLGREPNSAAAAPVNGRQVTKKDRAMAIYRARHQEGKRVVVAAFCQELDMRLAGARTYYGNCKKAFAAIEGEFPNALR